MKKFVSLFAALMLAVAAPLTSLAEEPLKPFEGLVTEIFDGGFLMEDTEMGLLQVNTDENTVMDGILSIQPLEVGMYVIVDHNGMMTRSLPPQVYGLRVGCYTLNGIAGEITPEGVLLTGDPIFGEVFVQMTPTKATVFPGVPMLVYYDGVMTMSLPGKVNARYVAVPEVTGVVSEKDGAGFTLTDADGNTYRILTSDALLVGQLAMNEEEPLPGSPEAEALAAEGTEVVVDEALATEEVAEEAESTVTEAEEATDETTEVSEPVEPAAEEAATAPNGEEAEEAPAGLLHDEVIAAQPEDALIQWGDGDTVTVYHQGPMDAVSGAELIALGMLVHR